MAQKKKSSTRSRLSRPETRRGKVIAGVIGTLVLLYLVYGVILYTTGGNDDVTRFVTHFAYYPAARVMVDGYLWWQVAAVVSAIALVVPLIKIALAGLRRETLSTQKYVILSGIALLAVISQFWLPPVSRAAIGYGAFLERVQTFEKIQAAQQQAQAASAQSDAAIKAQALNMLIASTVAQQEGTKLGVSVDSGRVEKAFDDQAKKVNGEKELKRLLRERLGWSVKEYKEELRTNVLLQESLNEKISGDDELNKDAKQKADGALKRLNDGEKFAEVAKDVSDDPTAEKGGDQGKLKRGEMDPLIEAEAFKIPIGEPSKVIKTSQGLVIIQVEKRSGNEVTLSQISIQGENVSTYFQKVLPKTSVWLFVDGQKWDKTLFTVQATEAQTPGPAGTGAPVPDASPAASPAS